MSPPPTNRPSFIKQLDSELTPRRVFEALEGKSGRLWFDSSAASGQEDDAAKALSRYSFVTADPLDVRRVLPGEPNPWPELDRWVSRLPDSNDHSLPPFQGGIAGLLGYEAARWLEPKALGEHHKLQVVDLPTPAICLGLYDWVVAFDHEQKQCWLISQGFTADELGGSSAGDSVSRRERANARAKSVEQMIAIASLSRFEPDGRWRSTPHLDPAKLADQLGLVSNFLGSEYRDAVAHIIERIRGGDSFQVNLAQRLLTPQRVPPDELYLHLRHENPAPFAGYYDGGDFQVLSSSPEGFLQLRDRTVATRPIKGTIARTGIEEHDESLRRELSASEKDRAENIMIVDLMRNDLSRVCTDDSVEVTQLCDVERFRYVQHLVSVVESRLRDEVSPVDLMRACFPGGSVTGAPKIEAMKTIARLETHPRGPYCGSLGYFGCGGNADFNILIRTITATRGFLQIPVGGGITAQSNPAAEEAETWTKAAGMLRAIHQAHEAASTAISAAS
ncbi:MAG: anthranilate synthase component I family protein [Planctomycetota bacterium]